VTLTYFRPDKKIRRRVCLRHRPAQKDRWLWRRSGHGKWRTNPDWGYPGD